MMALVVQLLSLCYKLLKKVRWFSSSANLMENNSVGTSHFADCGAKQKLIVLTLSSRWKIPAGSQRQIKIPWMVKLEQPAVRLWNVTWHSQPFYKANDPLSFWKFLNFYREC